MSFQKRYVESKARAEQAQDVDMIADWFIETALSASAEEFPESRHVSIEDGSARGWELHVHAHRKDYAGTIEHAIKDGRVIGHLVLREVLRNNELGSAVYKGIIFTDRYEYSDGVEVKKNYVGQTITPSGIRKRLAVDFLHAIQEALPQV